MSLGISKSEFSLKKALFVSGIILTLIVCRIPNRRVYLTKIWRQTSTVSTTQKSTGRLRNQLAPVVAPLQPSDARKVPYRLDSNPNIVVWLPLAFFTLTVTLTALFPERKTQFLLAPFPSTATPRSPPTLSFPPNDCYVGTLARLLRHSNFLIISIRPSSNSTSNGFFCSGRK